MNRSRSWITALILCFALGPMASAETKAPSVVTEAGRVATDAVAPGLLELAVEDLPPRIRRIRDVLAERDVELTALRARYEVASTDEEALRIQREIHHLKQGTELALLQVQLEFAQEDGDDVTVAEIEAVINRMEERVGLREAEPRRAEEREREP